MNPADPTRPADTRTADTRTADTRTADTRTADARTDPVSITEIADFLRQLRGLSRPPTPGGDPEPGESHDDCPDAAAERVAFLVRKADLFARIVAQHPDLAPVPTSPIPTGQPDGGPA